jgi:hypothetical protein
MHFEAALATDKFWMKNYEAAIEEEQLDLSKLGATANKEGFLNNRGNDVHYNVFVDTWKWVGRYPKRNHGDTHQ